MKASKKDLPSKKEDKVKKATREDRDAQDDRDRRGKSAARNDNKKSGQSESSIRKKDEVKKKSSREEEREERDVKSEDVPSHRDSRKGEKGFDVLEDELDTVVKEHNANHDEKGEKGDKKEETLDDFLKENRSVGSRRGSSKEEKRKSFDAVKEDLLKDERKLPPSISELEDGGAFNNSGIRNVDYTSKKDIDEESKVREYLFKFKLLQRSYPNEDFPKFTIHSSLSKIEESYREHIQNFALSDKIEKYKKFLTMGFIGSEYVIGAMGFDIEGFTRSQMVEMPAYEKLLIELGEKSYVPKSTWPVEFRLLGMIVTNAAIFVGMKMFSRSVSAASGSLPTGPVATGAKKQKMMGPNINLDDLDQSGVKLL
jgi:hypothetical protein